MNIQEYADILNIEISLIYYPNQKNRWSAMFQNCEVMGDGVLIGTYGNGTTPLSAIGDFIENIKGKKIVFGAGTLKRREFVVPETLSV